MAVVGASKAEMAKRIVAVRVLVEKNWHFHRYGVRLLHMDWVRPLYMHGVGSVNGNLDRHRNGSLDWVGDVLVNRIWLWVRHLHGHRVGPFNVHRYGTVNGHMHRYGHGFLNGNRDWDRLFNRVRGRNMYGVRPINGHLDGYTDVLHNRVRLRNGHFNFNGVWHVFLHGVGLRHWYFHGIWNVLLNWVRLRDKNLHGVGPVDWNVHGVRHLLLYRVWSGDMDWDLNVLLHVNWHMFDNLVGLRHGDLDGVRYRPFDGVWHMFLDGVGDRNSLNKSDGPDYISVLAKGDAMGVSAVGVSAIVNHVVSTTDSMSTAEVANIKTADAVPITEV